MSSSEFEDQVESTILRLNPEDPDLFGPAINRLGIMMRRLAAETHMVSKPSPKKKIFPEGLLEIVGTLAGTRGIDEKVQPQLADVVDELMEREGVDDICKLDLENFNLEWLVTRVLDLNTDN